MSHSLVQPLFLGALAMTRSLAIVYFDVANCMISKIILLV